MNNTQTEKQMVDRLIEVGGALTKVIETKDKPIAIIPSGCKVENLESFFPPKRIKASVTLLEAGSFAEYVNRFRNVETLIFAAVSNEGVSFRAVLDYHAADGTPDYCDHTATFNAEPTVDWNIWTAANRKPMGQVEFATWLEDNAKLFVEPNGAELLELVRTLHGHQNARFNTSLRLDNGASSVSYDEDVAIKGSSTTKAGEIGLPPVIKAGIAVFEGAPKYEITARLKSRVQERRLVLWFETIARHDIIRENVLLLTKQIAQATKIVPLLGEA